ncbi:MAG: DNA polymerase III subunit beta [Candidatus Aphodosoma sp.]
MKFTVSSSDIFNVTTVAGKIISSKNNEAILSNFLLEVKDDQLTITSTDNETTLRSKIALADAEGEVSVAIPTTITDSLKEFTDQPLNFDINTENMSISIKTETGEYKCIGQNGSIYPQTPAMKEDSFRCTVKASVLLNGINKTGFATSNEDSRPALTGILCTFDEKGLTFAATDAHILARVIKSKNQYSENCQFILPKKSASILKSILTNDEEDVEIMADDTNITFILANHTIICRKIEGKFPNYERIIPQDNPYELIVDRTSLLNSIKRVYSFTGRDTTGLVKLQITTNKIHLFSQDLFYNTSGNDSINCQYGGEDIKIGFGAPTLIKILNSMSTKEIKIQLKNPQSSGIILPLENEPNEDLLILIMPMLINE